MLHISYVSILSHIMLVVMEVPGRRTKYDIIYVDKIAAVGPGP